MAGGARARILVIDDERNVRAFVCELLKSLGYEADEAEDGGTGLALLGRQRYDLVITDLRMPHMSGWEVVARVRQHAPEMPVIMISGFATDDDVTRAQRIGIIVLHKPFSLADFRQALAQSLQPARKPLAKAEEGPKGETSPGEAGGRA